MALKRKKKRLACLPASLGSGDGSCQGAEQRARYLQIKSKGSLPLVMLTLSLSHSLSAQESETFPRSAPPLSSIRHAPLALRASALGIAYPQIYDTESGNITNIYEYT